jgi:hypothetical protein
MRTPENLCEHPEKQDVLLRCDREGNFTLRNDYKVPRATVGIFLKLLVSVTIIMARTQDRRARKDIFGHSGVTKIHLNPIPL